MFMQNLTLAKCFYSDTDWLLLLMLMMVMIITW